MTAGHRHRIIRVRSPRVWWVRLMRRPLYHCRNIPRVDRSPYPYGPCVYSKGRTTTCWTLSPLGILHRWTGLTIWYPDETKEHDDRHRGRPAP